MGKKFLNSLNFEKFPLNERNYRGNYTNYLLHNSVRALGCLFEMICMYGGEVSFYVRVWRNGYQECKKTPSAGKTPILNRNFYASARIPF